MTEAPINKEYLASMCGDDPEFEKELIDSYLEASPPLLSSTRGGVGQADADAVRAAAHTLKGSSRAIGAEPVAEVAEELEKLGRGGDVSDAAPLVEELDKRYAELESFARENWPE